MINKNITPQKMTPSQQVKIQNLIVKITDVVEHGDDDCVIQALSFCLLGKIKVVCNLSQRDAVDFCAECFKRYGQLTMS